MKTLLTLLLSIPLWVYSQDVVIGFKLNGTWFLSNKIVSTANSVAHNLGANIYFWGTSYQSDSALNLFGDVEGTNVADRMIIQVSNDTMYTAQETATSPCLNNCVSLGQCSTGCFKYTDCTCGCDAGGCTSENLAYPENMTQSFGAYLREKLIEQ